MAINAITTHVTASNSTVTDSTALNPSASSPPAIFQTSAAAPAAKASSTAAKAKDDTADFIDKAEKLILDPKSSTDDIMKFLKKESAGGKLNQEKQLALQELFQTRRETNDLLSNVFRMLADAALNVIRNIH